MVKRTFRRKNLKSRRRSSKKLTRKFRKNFLWGGMGFAEGTGTADQEKYRQMEQEIEQYNREIQKENNEKSEKWANYLNHTSINQLNDAPGAFEYLNHIVEYSKFKGHDPEAALILVLKRWKENATKDQKTMIADNITQLLITLIRKENKEEALLFYNVIPKKLAKNLYETIPGIRETYKIYKNSMKERKFI